MVCVELSLVGCYNVVNVFIVLVLLDLVGVNFCLVLDVFKFYIGLIYCC